MGTPGLEHVPAVRLENACATGSAALYAAMDFIAAGRGRVALVVGAEKMTAIPTAEVGDVLLTACYRAEEGDVEGGFAGIFGLIAGTYFQRYGDRSAELAMIAAKNHENGARNRFAHLQKDLGFDFCNTVSDKNPYVAGPLRRTDCSLVSDGAAALVLADAETAAGLERAIAFRARKHVNDVLAHLAPRPDRLRRRAPGLGGRSRGRGRRRHRPRHGRDPRLLHHGRDDRVRGDGPRRAGRGLEGGPRRHHPLRRRAAGEPLGRASSRAATRSAPPESRST